MTSKVTVILLFLTFGLIFSQEKLNWDVINKIQHEVTTNSKVGEIAWYMTDVNGPRLTGSPGLKKAQEWVMSELKKYGLKNVKLESWGNFGRGWVSNKYYAHMTAPYFENVIAYPKAWSSSTNGVISGIPVVIDIKTEEDFQKYKGKLAGKIVMVNAGQTISLSTEADAQRLSDDELEKMIDMMNPAPSRYDLPEFLKPYQQEIFNYLFSQRGAINRKIDAFLASENIGAKITISRGGKHGTVFTSNGFSYKANNKDIYPEFEVNKENFLKIERLLNKKIDVTLELFMENSFNDNDTLQYNVLAEIPGAGSLKDEVVMLGAHYDSWHASTGATDNAAGSSVMVEVVRILNSIGLNDKNRRTIRLALWSGEEQGLYGSRGYVKNTVADPKTMKLTNEHSKISAYYNLDNGGGRIRGVYLQGNMGVHSIFKDYLSPFASYGAETLTLSNTGGTDHLAFDAVGIPGFQFIQDPLEYDTRTHHSNMDSYDRLPVNDLKQASMIIASFVYHTAVRAEKLPRKVLPNANPNSRGW